MTKLTPKRKPFRRKMWAVVGGSYDWLVFYTYRRARECATDNGGTLIPVLITELPRKGRDGE